MTKSTKTAPCVVGAGEFRYEPLPDWGRLPAGWSFVEAVGVATDSQDHVYVFNRGDHPVIVFDRDGEFLTAWGEGQFARPHGIYIGPDDTLFLADDRDHTVRRYTPGGELLMVLGESGRPSDTGFAGDLRAITRGGPPFNLPTNLALASGGEMYVTDGYGNARVHKFTPDGELLFSWGEGGEGPGQFRLPHGITVDRQGRVLVADRENSRIQLFTEDGEFLEQWTDVVRPCEVFVDPQDRVFVAELGGRVGFFPWMTLDPTASGGRVSIFDRDGRLLARWGGSTPPCTPSGLQPMAGPTPADDFLAPHDIWLDSRGDIYVGEVVVAGTRECPGLDPAACPTLRKFERSAS